MCYVIDSESILLNYFSCAKSNEISFKSLRTIRRRIESDFDNSIYVDITFNSLRDAVQLHQNIFNMELTKISLKVHDSKELREDFINRSVNYRLPTSVKERYLKVFSQVCSEDE